MNNNLVFLEGYLLEKPELKTSKSGDKKYCNCGISVKGHKKVLETGYYDRTIFNFTAFGKVAERLCNFCDKGTRINMFGELGMNKYTTQENIVNEQGMVVGKKDKNNYQVQIYCTDFTILSKTQKNDFEESHESSTSNEKEDKKPMESEEDYYEQNKLSKEEDDDMFFDDIFDDNVPF